MESVHKNSLIMNNFKHDFAIYCSGLSSQISLSSKHFSITDADLVHRIRSVLRLAKNDAIILFDETMQATGTILDITKKTVSLDIQASNQTTPLSPSITVLLPLLKKEALERMIYSCVELGANTIQLVSTEKSQRSWRSDKELQRLHHIMIAAAEQSKQFAVPTLSQPMPLPEAVAHFESALKLVADPAGMPLYEILTSLHTSMQSDIHKSIVITMGPEGDFSDAEKTLLRAASYQAVRLTPTVLRSQQAGALLVGIVRSLT